MGLTGEGGGKAGKAGEVPSGWQELYDAVVGQAETANQVAQEQLSRLREQQAQRDAAFDALDLAFNDRQRDWQAAEEAALAEGTAAADEWKRHRERTDKFALAGRGLVGGSADVERGGRREEGYGSRIADAERAGRTAFRGLRGADMARRDQLRQQIAAGVPIGRSGTAFKGMFQQMPDYQGMRRKHTRKTIQGIVDSGLVS